MSRKGVSAEEKRSRMLQLFHEKGECFQLKVNIYFMLFHLNNDVCFKELEKLAPKEKGIIANSVKDVVQKLVEDGLVETDKIGTSVYFWSFPRSVSTIFRTISKFCLFTVKLLEQKKGNLTNFRTS